MPVVRPVEADLDAPRTPPRRHADADTDTDSQVWRPAQRRPSFRRRPARRRAIADGRPHGLVTKTVLARAGFEVLSVRTTTAMLR